MFLNSENYLDQVKQLADSSRNLDLAVAFWGEGAEKLFESWQGESLRIVCNLGSGGTNPEAIIQLQKLANVEVKYLDDLHAKVMLGNDTALIGSANFSTNGLGLEEDECAGWREAGILSKDQTHLGAIQAWFEKTWSDAQPVTEEALRDAKSKWKRRRNRRPKMNLGEPLLQQPLSLIKDRPIYLAIFRKWAGRQAQEAYEKGLEELKQSSPAEVNADKFDYFEDWPADSLPEERGAILINVYYGLRGKITVGEVVSRVPGQSMGYWSSDEDRWVPVELLVKEDTALGWTLDQKAKKSLVSRLKPWLELLVYADEPRSYEARCLPLHEFLGWEKYHLASDH